MVAGVEKGTYQANGLNCGLVTDYKDANPVELVSIQTEATRLQAEALTKIKDEKDYREFMGIK